MKIRAAKKVIFAKKKFLSFFSMLIKSYEADTTIGAKIFSRFFFLCWHMSNFSFFLLCAFCFQFPFVIIVLRLGMKNLRQKKFRIFLRYSNAARPFLSIRCCFVLSYLEELDGDTWWICGRNLRDKLRFILEDCDRFLGAFGSDACWNEDFCC